MQVCNFDSVPRLEQPVVFLLGVFDGVHLGHQYLFSRARAISEAKKIPMAALTFSFSPRSLKAAGKKWQVLTNKGQKRELLSGLGLSTLIELFLSPEIQNMEPLDFLKCLDLKLNIDTWVVGSDVGFGKGRSGDKTLLEQYVGERGKQAVFIEKKCVDGKPISSTRIHQALFFGDFHTASQLLGRAYRFRAECLDIAKDSTGEIVRLDTFPPLSPNDGGWNVMITGVNCPAILYTREGVCCLKVRAGVVSSGQVVEIEPIEAVPTEQSHGVELKLSPSVSASSKRERVMIYKEKEYV